MTKELSGLYLWEMKEYIIHELPANLGYFLAAFILLLLAKLARDITTRGIDDDAEITKKDNQAFGIYSAGYYLGSGLAFVGVFIGHSDGFWNNIVEVFQYGLTGIVFMGMSYVISDLVYLRKAKVMDALVAGNNAVAWFLAGRFVFTGLNVLAAIHGEGSWFVSFIYFILGEVGCWIGYFVYCRVTPYDDIREIENGTDAVGIVSAGIFLALGLLALNALWGDFLGYDVMLINFLAWFAGGVILLLLFRSVGSRILFPKSTLVKEIHRDNNKGAAAIMLAAYLVMATVIVLCF
ncbi:MAG: DUF350 domain-containing protein [Fibrobacteria bacterium]|nr:DUF350 domain-containing protein [Fibrobacteria bacterium]